MNWSDPNAKIANNFTMKEALWLPQWNRMATEKDGLGPQQKANLIAVFKVMDTIRSILNKPITVHVAYRSYSYNKLIGGAARSSHVEGMAVDFSVKGMSCDAVRAILVPRLEELQIRCEDLPGSNWVHIDIRQVGVGGRRFFKP